MNLLKKLSVNGDIFAEYAYLSFDFHFENRDYSGKSQYILRLPKSSCISNILIGTSCGGDENSKIIQPKIIASSHLSSLKNLKDIASLTRLSDDTYALKIENPNQECHLILNVYASLDFFDGKQGITVPLVSPQLNNPIKADVDILVHGAAISEIFSHSHNIQCRKTTDGISIGLCDVFADTDLNIEINARPHINSAAMATNGLYSGILCRIFPSERFLNEIEIGTEESFENIEINCGGSKGTIIKYPRHIGDSIDAIFEFCGRNPQTEFQIKYGNVCEFVIIEKSQVYNSFAPIRILYAERLCSELSKKLNRCTPDEIYSIKRQIERIGVKYSVLNTETAFVAELGNDEYGLIRTGSIKSESASYFRDSRAGVLDVVCKSESHDMSIHTLITLMHSDGAICENDEYNKDERKKQTLLAVLALISANAVKPNGEFMRAAKAYIGGSKICGMSFTSNSGTAIVMLKSFIMSNPDTTVGTPEFYSAIKQLCNANA